MLGLDKAVNDLERLGYCRLRQVYDPSTTREALERVRCWYEKSRNTCSKNVPFLNTDQPTVYNLQNKDVFFLKMLFDARILQKILVHFLNDHWFRQIPQHEPNYLLRSFIARSSNKRLPMHLDSFVPYLGNHVIIMQASIILEDQEAENGCTVVVPGSHLYGQYTTQDAFKEAVPINSRAGDIVIWDSRLWHGTTDNRSGNTRWAIVATFCRWWMKQHWNITQNLPQEIYKQLTESQRAILGFCSIPARDETTGIDLKRGYDDLLPDVAAYRER
ncbi:MAG: phytanoyl-CoA dioxygenase family protein [Alphaproteobacteria bacterium]